MTKLYRVTNPQEIIDHFERMAKEAEVRSVGAGIGVQERALYKREAITWQAAADILRQTEFIGWAFERPKPTKEEMERMAERYNERRLALREALALSEQKAAEGIKREMLAKIDRLGRKGERKR